MRRGRASLRSTQNVAHRQLFLVIKVRRFILVDLMFAASTNSALEIEMAASIFNPLSDDLINLINTFAKTSAILEGDNIPSSHDVHEATSLNLGAFLHQFWNHAEPQPSISTTDVETLSQALAEMSLDESGQPSSHHVSKKRETSSDASKAALDGVAAEVQVLRDALREPVQAINALIAMYIMYVFSPYVHVFQNNTNASIPVNLLMNLYLKFSLRLNVPNYSKQSV